ncbi:MAG TPA: heavy metal translocating P-type ATPase metal-binding domain-containing protein, partial [Desulfuromonadaceae bacterium]|nr:heavy metal translocating P-type ATPase metal-binding domain-containing protein [Desulfuromonadaceae bacterium]
MKTCVDQNDAGSAPGEFAAGSAVVPLPPPALASAEAAANCFHCGEPCVSVEHSDGEKSFCCRGCLTVYELLSENGLGRFYDLNRTPGTRAEPQPDRFAYLDDPVIQPKVLDFTDGKTCRVTFHIPAIHCVACVWLLERLFQLHAGIGLSRVHLARRELAVTFAADKITLGELAGLLASIGYEPSLTLAGLEKRPRQPTARRWLQVGVAGFAFGNIMLFSVPRYFGLSNATGPGLQAVFGYLSLALALPVLVFSASDFWKTAWLAARRRAVTLDIPIAIGLAALYAQSAFDIFTGRGEGYLDSMTGLIFFLLCGRAFQQLVHERLAFDRDYKSFFPLAAVRISGTREEPVAISELKVGDRLLIRNNELIPADSVLIDGMAWVDYSFVTGESEPKLKQAGAYLYAGGRQKGAAIDVRILKPVSQSYLTALWSQQAFGKTTEDG